MLAFMAVFRHSRNVRWGLVFLLAALFALGGCGGGSSNGGSSDEESPPDPTPEPLTLSAPVLDGALVAGVQRELQLGYGYDPAWGEDDLVEVRFSLEEAPTGMTLLEDTGTLLWTPSPALEGSEHTVRVRAELGDETAEVTFPVSVALSTPVATSVVGNTVTVTQPGSLQGLAITVPVQASRPASQVQVRVVDEAQAPPLSEGAVRLSDFFVVSPVSTDEGAMIVSLPSALVPPGMHVEDLSLFNYEEAIEFGVWDPDVDSGPTDSASWAAIGFDFDITEDALKFEVGALGTLSFVGYYPDPDAVTGLGGAWDPEFRTPTALEPLDNGSRCQRQVLPDGISLSVRIWECEADGFRFQIRRLAPINWSAGLTPDDVLGWALEARTKIRGLNMNADDRIGVLIQPMRGALGKFSPRTPRALYLRNRLPVMFELTRAEVAKHVLAHEFFHHAQFRTRIDGRENMIASLRSGVAKKQIVWAIEGTAVWFEDEVYDASNRYRRHVPSDGVPAFLSRKKRLGLGFTLDKREPYRYFPWWKLLSNRCPSFSVRDMLNVADGDQWGVRSLAERINSPAWGCSFNPGFEGTGGLEQRFASALLYYVYATDEATGAAHNSLALMDPGEASIKFAKGRSDSITPSEACCGDDLVAACPSAAGGVARIGKASVRKVAVAEITPETGTALFQIDNRSATTDLYAYLVQGAPPNRGWPSGAGRRIPPGGKTVVSAYSDPNLNAPYHGTWSLVLVNPNPDAIQTFALAAGNEFPVLGSYTFSGTRRDGVERSGSMTFREDETFTWTITDADGQSDGSGVGTWERNVRRLDLNFYRNWFGPICGNSRSFTYSTNHGTYRFTRR